MKRFLTFLFSILILVTLNSCFDSKKPSSDRTLAVKTEKAMQEANRQVGLPSVKNFQEKKLMKMIYELRDQENLICFAYYVDLNGRKHFLGKSIGFGIPYSTQFSNPEKVVNLSDNLGSNLSYKVGKLPQPEPNGLFMPQGLSATWLLLIDPKTNEPRPVYIEPEIIVSPFKLH